MLPVLPLRATAATAPLSRQCSDDNTLPVRAGRLMRLVLWSVALFPSTFVWHATLRLTNRQLCHNIYVKTIQGSFFITVKQSTLFFFNEINLPVCSEPIRFT